MTEFAEDPLEVQHAVLQRLTPHASMRKGVVSAARWGLFARAGSQVLQLAGILITARLLTPADYGKLAVIVPVTNFASILTDMALGSGLIHARRVTERLLATAFWLNALTGVGLCVIVGTLSFPLARFYDEPQLVPLVWLSSLTFALNLALVQTSLLERTFRFRAIATIELVSTALNIALVAVLAARGAGAYSVVIGILLYTLCVTGATSAVVRYRPRAWMDRESARELWRFTGALTGYNVVNFWSRNADNLVLGRFVSQVALGNYSRSYQLMRLPIFQMSAMMNRVLFPALSRLRDDPKRLGRAWLRALAVAGSITTPISLGIAVIAPSMVHVLFGQRWMGMVPILEILSVAALPQIYTTTVGGVLRATDATHLLFRLSLISAAMTFVAIGVGLPWGTLGVAIALTVKFFLELPLGMVPCLRRTGVTLSELWDSTRGTLIAGGLMYAAGWAVRLSMESSYRFAAVLVAQFLVCAAVYLTTLRLLDKRLMTEILSLVRRGAR
ncbi:MAG: polysaccharide transporter, family [Actinomycetota bacterium]|nr:polysaccharide transporter, family [Actinomycetota bacterium]